MERYQVVGLNHTLAGKLPADVACPIPKILSPPAPASLRLIRRCTFTLSDPSQNHRLSTLSSHYDLLAVRPTTAAALQQACQHLDPVGLISLDMTVRHPYHFKHSLCRAATARGIRFEICYAPSILATDTAARRNLISNATQLIRATRGRGIVLSSEAPTAVGLRAPIDVINLATVWGLSTDRARQAIETEARATVVLADMRRTSWRGVVDVVDGGDLPPLPSPSARPAAKRKLDDAQSQKDDEAGASAESKTPGTTGPGPGPKPVQQSKRQAKKARVASAKSNKS
ncbi:MAG: hypothetical protein M1838_005964 [Thelocarpon superellum]|nr:MAG: hypothetical protein M1838_005964 [Thelocarpon superellum]